MSDELIDSVAQKTGLDRAKAEEAITAVLDWFRENPERVREHVEVGKIDFKGILDDSKKRITPVVEKGKTAASGAQKKISPVAAQGADKLSVHAKKASDKLKELSKRGSNGSSEFDDVLDEADEAVAATATSEN